MIVKNILDDSAISALKNGQLIIAKTDTIYGILAAANSEKAVERLYEVKRRPLDKPVIILVANIDDIPDLTPSIKHEYQEISKNRPTTIITKVSPNFLPHSSEKWRNIGIQSRARISISRVNSNRRSFGRTQRKSIRRRAGEERHRSDKLFPRISADLCRFWRSRRCSTIANCPNQRGWGN